MNGNNSLDLPVYLPKQQTRAPRLGGLLRLWPVIVILAALPFAGQSEVGLRFLMAMSLGLILLCVRSSSLCIVFSICYLAILGGLRRWLIPSLGLPPLDPLLLVTPAFIAIYFANDALSTRLRSKTRLSRLVLWLVVVMLVQILNPVQGGPIVGVGGAFFYLGGLLWFYAGRNLGSEGLLRRIYGLVIGIAILAAVYGLYQVFVGFLPSELEWIRRGGYAALSVGNGKIRPFSFFTSSAEYAALLSMAICLLWSRLIRGNAVAFLPIPLLSIGLFLTASRTPVVLTVATCAVLVAIQGRDMKLWAPRLLVVVALTLVGFMWSLRQVQQRNQPSELQNIVSHQTEGLLDPYGHKDSTTTMHQEMILGGFASGIRHPLGYGLGYTTLAASMFGRGGGSTELDLSDAFVALGIIGGTLYLIIVGKVLWTASRFWHERRSSEALGLLALLLAQFGGWLLAGRYCTMMILWCCIGTLDRLRGDAVKAER